MTARGDLTSANTVGYSTINLEEGKWYMVIPQFTKTGEVEGDTFNALDVMQFKGLVAGLFNTRDIDAPQIQVHRSSDDGYDKYYYISDAMRVITGQAPQVVTGWCAGAVKKEIEEVTVKQFKGFWLRIVNVQDGATLTVAGQVRALDEPIDVNVGTEGEWQIIGNPYPCDLLIQNMSVTGLTPGTFSGRDTDAPQIQVHRPSDDGYDKYYYVSDAMRVTTTPPSPVTAWVKGAVKAEFASGKICDSGKGFWLRVPKSGSGKLTFQLKND